MAVYGNRAFEDTLAELADLLCAAGFRCTAGVAAVAQHSIFPQFAAKRPDAADAAQLAAFARQVRAALDGGAVPRPVLPGNRPYRPLGVMDLKPRAGAGCTACGLCASRCPVGAIPLQAPRKPMHPFALAACAVPPSARPMHATWMQRPWPGHSKGCKRPARPASRMNCFCEGGGLSLL